MDGKIIDHAPQAHCYRCGATEIAGICTHCQQCMCQMHLSPTPRRGARRIARLLFRLRVVHRPYDGSVLLCRDCQKVPLMPFLLLILALAVMYITAGVWYRGGVVESVGLVGIGLLFLGLLWGAGRYLTDDAGRRATIFVAPRIDRRQIQEWVRGRIVLNPQGDYHVEELSAEGRFTLGYGFSEADQKRVANFVSKHRKTSLDLRYHAGFVLLKGLISYRPLPSPTSHVAPLPGPVVMLGDRIANAPFFTGVEGRAARQGEARYGYSLLQAPEAKTFPVQVLPAIRPDSEQRVLDLTVQWFDPRDEPVARLTAYQIDLLRMEVPTSWGGIEYATSGLRTDVDMEQIANASIRRVLRWERVSLTRRDLERQQRVFTIKFEQPVRQQDILRGVVQIAFWNSLSGITGIESYLPSGKPSPLDEGAGIATVVVANFDLSLGALRYQKTLVCPDQQPPPPFGAASPQDADQAPQDMTPRMAAIVPDANTVAQLTNALSEANFYIQWMVENRPQTGAAATVTHRYWDIGGRYYQNVNPIDFHLMVTGQQSSAPGAADDGQTVVSLTVKGAYVTETMRREIINVWRRLDDVVAKTLENLERQAGAEV